MPTFTMTKNWNDLTTLTEAQLDDIKTSAETFLNVTKLDSDNIQANGIATANLANSVVTESKLNDDAVTTNKIADNAITAAKISAAARAAVGVPPGAILPFGGASAPTGYLLCDGTAVSRTTYADLFAAIGEAWGEGDDINTFRLPDLRGEFLRGVDGGTGRDPDAGARTASDTGGNTGDAVGTLQGFAIQSHGHNLGYPARAGSNGPQSGGSSGPIAAIHDGTDQPTATKNSGGAETRPRNAAVNFIIKT